MHYQTIQTTMPADLAEQYRAICTKRPEVFGYFTTPIVSHLPDDRSPVRVTVLQDKEKVVK